MRARDLRKDDLVVLSVAQVESVFTEEGKTYVAYADEVRTADVFECDRELLVVRPKEEE